MFLLNLHTSDRLTPTGQLRNCRNKLKISVSWKEPLKPGGHKNSLTHVDAGIYKRKIKNKNNVPSQDPNHTFKSKP